MNSQGPGSAETTGGGGTGERWSFRRFEADVQAQASADTWDELHRRGLAVLTEIDENDGSLYETSRQAEEAMRVLAIPRTADCTAAARQSTAAARDLLATLQDVAPLTAAAGGEGGGDPDSNMYVVSLNARQIETLRRQLRAWVSEASKLVARTNTTIETVRATRERLGAMDTRVRDFILTIWSLNAEKAKAYPPFFADIGPIESTLYGIGRTTTSTSTTAAAAAAGQATSGAPPAEASPGGS